MSFVLGMSTVAVITIAIVAVLGFVKARKTEEELKIVQDQFSRDLAHVYDTIAKNYDSLDRSIHNSYRSLSSNTDSRFDKLIHTIERDYITKKDKLNNSIDYNN